MKRADEWTAEMDGLTVTGWIVPSHSVRPPLFRLSWEFRPPIMEAGGGLEFLWWVMSEMMLVASFSCSITDWTDWTARESSCGWF